jgi:catechol 2,3-dioxygenase-like lactoylglutathione lyase family enzyme
MKAKPLTGSPGIAVASVALIVCLAGVARAADYHHVHLAVASPTLAVQWYSEHMECRLIDGRTDAVDCGNIAITFGALATVGGSPGTGVDHISFSFPDLTAKMAELERAGVGGRGVRLQRFDDGSTLSDIPGLFTHGFVFDPWGTRIELVEDVDYPGFHHIHLSAADPDASLRWYQDVLGGERARLGEQIEGLLFDNAWLLVSAHPEGTPASTDGRAIDHIGFMVSDLDEAAVGMRARGVDFQGPPEAGRTTARRAYLAGPDSVKLAVVEPGWVEEASRVLIADAGAGIAPGAAEPYEAPRTPWGTPDLQGIWTSNRAHGIPLERPTDAESRN